MWETTFLLISLALNALSFFYVRWLLRTIAAINQDVDNVTNVISDFNTHLSSVYELEMFYGDDTLKGLMVHAKDLSETLKDLDLVLNEPAPIEAEESVEETEKKKN